MVSGYDVELVNEDKMDEFIVKFKGPADSPYAGVIITIKTYLILGWMESQSDASRSVPH